MRRSLRENWDAEAWNKAQRDAKLAKGTLLIVTDAMRAEMKAELDRLKYDDDMLRALPEMPSGLTSNLKRWFRAGDVDAYACTWNPTMKALKAAAPETVVYIDKMQRREFMSYLQQAGFGWDYRTVPFQIVPLTQKELMDLRHLSRKFCIVGERWERAFEGAKTLAEKASTPSTEPLPS